MVLVYALMGCLSVKAPQASTTPTPVSTVITLASPEDDAHLPTPTWCPPSKTDFPTMDCRLSSNNADKPHRDRNTRPSSGLAAKQSGGALSVMIETEARPRSQLGSIPMEVTATITVANRSSSGRSSDFPSPLCPQAVRCIDRHRHRLAEKTALITRYQRSGS